MPEIFEELDRQADKWEPTAAAISLGSLGLGAGISTTAVGAPIGGIIAGVGQLPSLVIDGYQAGRDNKIYYLSKDQYIKPNSGQPLDYTMDYLGSDYDYNNGGTKGNGFNLKPNKNNNGYVYFDRKD